MYEVRFEIRLPIFNFSFRPRLLLILCSSFLSSLVINRQLVSHQGFLLNHLY